LRGSVRVENVEYPAQYIPEVLKRVQPRHLQRTYGVTDYEDSVGFLELVCRKMGRLLKGGEADLDGAGKFWLYKMNVIYTYITLAKQVLNDWIRGKLPWFTPPPYKPEGEESGPINEKREGKLGEMSKKRKRGTGSEAAGSVAATTDATGTDQDEDDDDEDDEDDEFGGFSEDDGLELDAEDDDDDDGEELSDDEEGGTLLEATADELASDDDEVEEEIAAISQALSKAKKRQRTT
jgi:nuclear GTP-binding protein